MVKQKSLSFRNKVFISSFICIGLPVLITLCIYNYLTKDTVKEQAIQNANKELELTEEYVSKLFTDIVYVVNFVQLNPGLNATLKQKANEAESNSEQGEYEQFLDDRSIIETIENITLVGEKSYVTIILKNGKSYTNYPVSDYDPSNMFKEKWFEQLKTIHGYESVWLGAHPTLLASEKSRSPYQLSVARTLRDQSFNIYGYVVVTMMENKVNQVFENQVTNEEIMLLNSENKIVSHVDTEKIGHSFPYEEHVQQIGKSNIIEINQTEYLLTEKKVSFNNWKLVSLVPYKEAISKINSIFTNVFLLLAVSFAIFFILLAYLINRITKPLVDLGEVVSRVQSGDLSVRSHVQSNDELGRFSKSFNSMLDRIHTMIAQITETQTRKRKAELAMLQAQINPHFLFNVLNSIRMKVLREGNRESATMISSLSKLLRMTIATDKSAIRFYDEVSIALNYVNLMNMRQKEDVEFMVEVPEEVYQHNVPRFILQPIIENSIIHGLRQSTGAIKLEAWQDPHYFSVKVSDNGQGMGEESLQHLLRHKLKNSARLEGERKAGKEGLSGIGLPNVYERLSMYYGNDFHMQVESEMGQGTSITLHIPLRKEVRHV